MRPLVKLFWPLAIITTAAIKNTIIRRCAVGWGDERQVAVLCGTAWEIHSCSGTALLGAGADSEPASATWTSSSSSASSSSASIDWRAAETDRPSAAWSAAENRAGRGSTGQGRRNTVYSSLLVLALVFVGWWAEKQRFNCPYRSSHRQVGSWKRSNIT